MRKIVTLLVVFMVATAATKTIDAVNNVLAADHQIQSLPEWVGMDGMVETLKEHGVPMTPPVLLGVFLALAFLPKATMLSVPVVKAGARGGWKLVGTLLMGAKQASTVARFVGSHPRSSVASVAALLGTLLTGAFVFRDEIPVVNDGVEQVRTLVDTGIAWCRTDVSDNAVKWLFELGLVAVVLMTIFVSRKATGLVSSETHYAQRGQKRAAIHEAHNDARETLKQLDGEDGIFSVWKQAGVDAFQARQNLQKAETEEANASKDLAAATVLFVTELRKLKPALEVIPVQEHEKYAQFKAYFHLLRDA